MAKETAGIVDSEPPAHPNPTANIPHPQHLTAINPKIATKNNNRLPQATRIEEHPAKNNVIELRTPNPRNEIVYSGQR